MGKRKMTEDEIQMKEFKKRQIAKIESVAYLYLDQYSPYAFSDHFKKTSLKYFIEKLDLDVVIEALEIVIDKIPDKAEDALKYFCGICWNKIRYPNALSIVRIEKNDKEGV